MASINLAVISGHIGRDAETKFTQSGTPVTRFAVATSKKYQKDGQWQEKTTWHNVVVWQREKLAQYLVKGTKVTIQGEIENRSYDDKDGTKRYVSEIIAHDIVLGGSGQQAGGGGASAGWDEYFDQRPQPATAAPASRTPGPPAAKATSTIDDWDVPF